MSKNEKPTIDLQSDDFSCIGMYIDDKWYTETDVQAYVKELKLLLQLAIIGFDKILPAIKFTGTARVCDYAMEFANPFDACSICPLGNAKYEKCKWNMYDEALRLIGENHTD